MELSDALSIALLIVFVSACAGCIRLLKSCEDAYNNAADANIRSLEIRQECLDIEVRCLNVISDVLQSHRETLDSNADIHKSVGELLEKIK